MSATGLSVAAPAVTDETHWQSLYRGYADFYQVPMTDETLQTVWQWIHDVDNPFYCLVARSANGSLLGLMHFRAMASPLRGTTVGFLDDLFVHPDARGTGVVQSLYTALKIEAKHHGWPLIRWITAENNYRARSLYDQLASKTQWVTYQLEV